MGTIDTGRLFLHVGCSSCHSTNSITDTIPTDTIWSGADMAPSRLYSCQD